MYETRISNVYVDFPHMLEKRRYMLIANKHYIPLALQCTQKVAIKLYCRCSVFHIFFSTIFLLHHLLTRPNVGSCNTCIIFLVISPYCDRLDNNSYPLLWISTNQMSQTLFYKINNQTKSKRVDSTPSSSIQLGNTVTTVPRHRLCWVSPGSLVFFSPLVWLMNVEHLDTNRSRNFYPQFYSK